MLDGCGKMIGPYRCCTVVCGDCLELMKSIPDGAVDAVITDPPYGIGYVHSGKGSPVAGRSYFSAIRHSEEVIGDDLPFDPVPLLRFKNVIAWGANHYCDKLPSSIGRWLIWDKADGRYDVDSFGDAEIGWHSLGKANRIFRYAWKGVYCVKEGEDNGRRRHPTMKPIGLMAWCIHQAGDPETIIDPFLGSGTTAVAAKKLGRHFLGFEISPEYCRIAEERIALVESKPTLFEKLPEQMTLETA